MTERPLTSPRWARLAARGAPAPEAGTGDPGAPVEPGEPERCELCAQAIPERHRHLFDIEKGALLCACQACSTLMDHRAAGGSHYRLVPREGRRLVDLELPPHRWAALGVPVELVFFTDSTPHGGLTAFFPGALGATETRPDPAAWSALVADNPVLETLEPDVEALLVRRRDGSGDSNGAFEAYLAPIDACHRLTGRIRSRWRGLAGGPEVREAVDEFFRELAAESIPLERAPAPSNAATPQEVTP